MVWAKACHVDHEGLTHSKEQGGARDVDARHTLDRCHDRREVGGIGLPPEAPIDGHPKGLQAVTIFALQKGYYDSVDLKKVTATAASIREFFKTRQDALLTEIRTKAALDKDIEAKIIAALDAWKSTAA